MDEDLKEILGEKEQETTPSEETTQVVQEEDPEVKKKREQLDNLNKAISEAQGDLKKLRKAKKEPDEEELPKIDLEDPNAKAWDSHIRKTVGPVADEQEKEKEEVRGLALREFIKEHPDLAQDREKLNEVMGTYNRIKTSTEKNEKVILQELEKAYAAENYEALTEAARVAREQKGQDDLVFSEPGITRGATSYSTERETPPRISESDRDQLQKWGMTPKEWFDLKKKYPN